MKEIISILLILCIFQYVSSAQESTYDLIETKNSRIIKAKITDTDESTIYFSLLDGSSDIVRKMDKSEVLKVIYGYKPTVTSDVLDQFPKDLFDGNSFDHDDLRQISVNQDYMHNHVYVENRPNNVKFNLSAIGLASGLVSYERAFNHRSSFEAIVALHGVQASRGINQKEGLGLELGYKLKLAALLSSYYVPDHILAGTYIKGLIGGASVNERKEFFSFNGQTLESKNRNYAYVGLDIGYQWILNNRVSLDIYAGMQYYNGEFEVVTNENGNITKSTRRNDFEDGDIFGNNNFITKAGFRVGYLFNFKKPEDEK